MNYEAGLSPFIHLVQCSSFIAHHSSFIIKITMTGNRTFTMIKPDAVRAGNIGNILQMINAAGFRIVAMKLTKLSMEKAGEFYAVHRERPFYGELCEFMSSGPIVAASRRAAVV